MKKSVILLTTIAILIATGTYYAYTLSNVKAKQKQMKVVKTIYKELDGIDISKYRHLSSKELATCYLI